MLAFPGQPADYGKLHFFQTGSVAEFLTVANTTPARLTVPFLEKHWLLPKPEIIISVTGSAQALNLQPALEAEFNKGIVSAAGSANAWVITGSFSVSTASVPRLVVLQL